MDKRMAGRGNTHWGPGAPRRLASEAVWREPLRWNVAADLAGRQERVFCASMADVFDEEAPPGALARLWGLIEATPSLDWLLLTKRPERIRASLPPTWGNGWSNVWLGTSVEDQKRADERVPILQEIPARVRFLSCEPLLGQIDLFRASPGDGRMRDRVQWVIAGGESGPGARRCDVNHVRVLRSMCMDAGIRFFFKQWGTDASNPDIANDPTAKRNGGSTKGGRLLDGCTWDEIPWRQEVAAA